MISAGASLLMSNALGSMSGVGAVRPAVFPRGESGADREGAGSDRAEDGRFGPAVVVSVSRSGGGGAGSVRKGGRDDGRESGRPAVQGDGLTEEERGQVAELKARDREVRAHETAHMTAGGQHAGTPSYTYQVGPDGQRYAIGGEVRIDTSPEKDPEATIRKMEIVKRAALAPAEPSAQDVKVAQMAEQQRMKAQAELRRQKAEEAEGGGGDAGADAGAGARDAGSPRAGGLLPAAMAAYEGAGRLGAARGAVLFRTA